MSDPIERIIKEAGNVLRPLLQQAFEAGAKSERARIYSILEGRSDENEEPKPNPPREVHTLRRRRGGKKGLRKGSMNEIVYGLIKNLPERMKGVSADTVFATCQTYRHNFSMEQVRTALKLLERSNYLVRLERGKYAPKDEAPPEDQSEGASETVGEHSHS